MSRILHELLWQVFTGMLALSNNGTICSTTPLDPADPDDSGGLRSVSVVPHGILLFRQIRESL